MADVEPTKAMTRADPWLEWWLPAVEDCVDRLGSRQVLEIGCGTGDDTLVLVQAGLEVTAFDLSAKAVEACRERVTGARISQQDVREPWPTKGTKVAVVVASLSLHYFPWRQTVELFERIREQLMPGGLLLCRLNSTGDVNFGAKGHPAIDAATERSFFLVDGQPKRFFDAHDLGDLVRESGPGWVPRSQAQLTTTKYGAPKAMWELILEVDRP